MPLFIFFVWISSALPLVSIAYQEGYKAGQADAIIGKFRYKIVNTTKVEEVQHG